MERQEDFDDDWDAVYVPSSKPATTPGTPAPLTSAAPVQRSSPAKAAIAEEASSNARTWDDRAVPHRSRPCAFPSFTSRSALFRATKATGTFNEFTPIKAQGTKLQGFGPKLDMRDKRIWEIAIELAKERAANIGDIFEVQLREFARRMGIESPNARALRSIWAGLNRLAMARVAFELNGGQTQGLGSLIASAIREGDRFFIRLNPDFAYPALLCDLQFDMNPKRRAAIGSALGQWLHDFYCTHSKGLPIHLGYLMDLCGYDGESRNFPGQLKAAMDELVSIAPGVAASYDIQRPTRRFEDWILTVQIGGDTRQFQRRASLPTPRVRHSSVVL